MKGGYFTNLCSSSPVLFQLYHLCLGCTHNLHTPAKEQSIIFPCDVPTRHSLRTRHNNTQTVEGRAGKRKRERRFNKVQSLVGTRVTSLIVPLWFQWKPSFLKWIRITAWQPTQKHSYLYWCLPLFARRGNKRYLTDRNCHHTMNTHQGKHYHNNFYNHVVTIVVGERRRGPRCNVVRVHDLLIPLNTRTKITKMERTKQSCLEQRQRQKTTTHNSRAKPGCLSMVLNQRQWLTAATDWEPYQAKRIEIQT